MLIQINVKTLIENRVSVEQALILFFINAINEKGTMELLHEYQEVSPLYTNDIKYLIDEKYLVVKDGFEMKEGETFSIKNLILTEKFRIFVDDASWTKEWFELWPKGLKSGGYYVRTDESGCRIRLKRFMQKYPKYDKDIIIKATKNYIDRCLKSGSYFRLAPHFIEKEGISVLAGECEALIGDSTEEKNAYKEV